MNYWIDINEKQPEEFQEVAFIVKSDDPTYNKRRMGGRYQGKKAERYPEFTYHAFTTPGVEWAGSHWMPLPDLPPCTCGFQHHPEYNGHNQ